MAKTPTRSGNKKAQNTIQLNLEGKTSKDKAPDIALSFWSGNGKAIFSADVADDGTVKIDPGALEKTDFIRVGPKSADADDLMKIGLNATARQFQSVLKTGMLDVGRDIWIGWLPWLRCVTGRVRVCRPGRWWFDDLVTLAAQPATVARATKSPSIRMRAVERPLDNRKLVDDRQSLQSATRLPAAQSIDQLIAWPVRCAPICEGTVEVWRRVCCCDPWIVFDPRIPDLLDDLDRLIPDIPLPPDPGPYGPRPLPIDGNPIFKDGTLDVRAIHAARDLAALRKMPAEQVPTYINARPHLFCPNRSCGSATNIATGSIGPDGQFNICWRQFPVSLRAGCHFEYAYVIRQQFGPFSIVVYNGLAANQWYHQNDNPTLTTYSRFAYGCRNNPDGNFVFLNAIADTGAHHLNTPTATGATSVATPAIHSGLVFTDPATAPSNVINRNWGGTLKLNFTISEGMQALGAKFYRLSVYEADANGNPVGSPEYLTEGLSWNKAVSDGSGGVDIVPVGLGPQSAGAGANEQNALFLIPYDTAPTTDWLDNQFHAKLNTNDPRWNDPLTRHLVTLEIFDEDGRRLRPTGTPATGLGGQETTAAFTYRRRFQETGATDEVQFGALTHMFWWDNRDVFADIINLRKDGMQFDAECLFFGGTGATTFSVGYQAYHPNEMFQLHHNITWRRGLGSTPGSSGVLQPTISTNVTDPNAGSATNTFAQMLLPAAVDPPRNKCAFTAFLNIYNKRTDGDDYGFQYRGDTAAFVIEIDS
ncbi:hypothetical protein ROLI_027400 [Roseobacter fucihabitans]|uniref:Uncharacterized protein n=1 Tax=Roseobacter fucihabitans TaxID=1537242 RepID=A0ABZ2BWX5_9RHOB|nr:hypothetical protein [Roseobacter litoralis]MBC6966113.1 hypothetical protein [Roseobacter litoralis]